MGIPIGLTAFLVFRPDNLQAVIENVRLRAGPLSPPLGATTYAPRGSHLVPPLQRSYVRYPPEGKRPPNWEELQELLRKERSKK